MAYDFSTQSQKQISPTSMPKDGSLLDWDLVQSLGVKIHVLLICGSKIVMLLIQLGTANDMVDVIVQEFYRN